MSRKLEELQHGRRERPNRGYGDHPEVRGEVCPCRARHKQALAPMEARADATVMREPEEKGRGRATPPL